MRTESPQTSVKKIKELLGTKNYEQFVKRLGKLAKDRKVRLLLTSGLFDGNAKDEAFKMEVVDIPVKNLRPTQSEIDLDQSLGHGLLFSFPSSMTDILNGKSVEIVAPIVTLNGKYILDGHHRWSQIYSFNKDAEVTAINFKGDVDPIQMLKILQMAIASEIKEVPTKNVKGTNLLKTAIPKLKSEVKEKITKDAINAIHKAGKIEDNNKDEAVQYIAKNVSQMKKTSQPIEGAPSRNFMPQTDQAKETLETAREGSVNYKTPIIKKRGGSAKKSNYEIWRTDRVYPYRTYKLPVDIKGLMEAGWEIREEDFITLDETGSVTIYGGYRGDKVTIKKLRKGGMADFDSTSSEQWSSVQDRFKRGGSASSKKAKIKSHLKDLDAPKNIQNDWSINGDLVVWYVPKSDVHYGATIDEVLDADDYVQLISRISPLGSYKRGGSAKFKKVRTFKELENHPLVKGVDREYQPSVYDNYDYVYYLYLVEGKTFKGMGRMLSSPTKLRLVDDFNSYQSSIISEPDKFKTGGSAKLPEAKDQVKTYVAIDVDDPQDGHFMSDSEVEEYIADWNREMQTNYANVSEFNKGEEYYRIKKLQAPFSSNKTGGSVKKRKSKTNRPIKVRFHLGRGKNFMKWKIEKKGTKKSWFFEPDKVQLIMTDCELTNQPNQAKKIFEGKMNKAPIAWILCKEIKVSTDPKPVKSPNKIFYNPRKAPHWVDSRGNNIDFKEFPQLISYGRKVFVKSGDKTFEYGGEVPTMKTGGKAQSTAEDKFIYVMREFGKGRLKHGTTGKVVTDKDMAVAIAFSEAREIDPKFGKMKTGGSVPTGGTVYEYKNKKRGTTKVTLRPFVKGKATVNVHVTALDPETGKQTITASQVMQLSPADVDLLKDFMKKNNASETNF
jgi:hypothetical protein